MNLPNYAFSVSVPSFANNLPGVDAADFHAMAINFAIESEMAEEKEIKESERNFDLAY